MRDAETEIETTSQNPFRHGRKMLKNVVKEEKTGAGEQKDVIEECADSI